MMSVDRKLRETKEEYHHHIPTSFTEKDKQNVFQAISAETQPKRPKLRTYFLKPAAMTVYATVALFVGGVTMTQLGPEDTLSTQNVASSERSIDLKDTESFQSVGGGSDLAAENRDQVATTSQQVSFDFSKGESLNGMTVTNVDSNQATFSGERVLSGRIVANAKGTPDEYLFHISDLTKKKLPLTEDHEGVLYLTLENNEQFVDLLHQAEENESFIKFLISDYHYSNGSTGADASRSITVAGVILNGEYYEVSPNK